ncbi:MAG: dephospho-CoA kinase [Actinomycetota bacterium]|nr:dephospho-CoA kinase [Actinomycetota bacterium]
MLVVGLTGGIGSGKSSVAAMLAERGAVVVNADFLARKVVEPSEPALAAIVERFGDDVLLPDGQLDRAVLAQRVFGDAAALADLNAIVHPAVERAIREVLEREQPTDHVVILEVPLWVEKGYGTAAGVIVVDCPTDVAVRRLVEQRGMAEDDVRKRAAAQASREERLARANFVINNEGTLDDLRRQAEDAWEWIQTLRSGQQSGGQSPRFPAQNQGESAGGRG